MQVLFNYDKAIVGVHTPYTQLVLNNLEDRIIFKSLEPVTYAELDEEFLYIVEGEKDFRVYDLTDFRLVFQYTVVSPIYLFHKDSFVCRSNNLYWFDGSGLRLYNLPLYMDYTSLSDYYLGGSRGKIIDYSNWLSITPQGKDCGIEYILEYTNAAFYIFYEDGSIYYYRNHSFKEVAVWDYVPERVRVDQDGVLHLVRRGCIDVLRADGVIEPKYQGCEDIIFYLKDSKILLREDGGLEWDH